jgi:hypothetical protein
MSWIVKAAMRLDDPPVNLVLTPNPTRVQWWCPRIYLSVIVERFVWIGHPYDKEPKNVVVNMELYIALAALAKMSEIKIVNLTEINGIESGCCLPRTLDVRTSSPADSLAGQRLDSNNAHKKDRRNPTAPKV